MLRFNRLVASLALAALVTGAAAGCGRLPTAPATTETSSSPTVVGNTAESSGLLGDLVGGLLRLVFKVLNVVGSLGGSLTNGRWRVDIPAGAIDGNATVGIGVSSSTSNQAELQITPEDKNHFSTPVRVTVSCSGVSDATLRGYVILWYNPATKLWVPVEGSTVDLASRSVSAPLQHFSLYRVGPDPNKAGW